MKCEECGGEDGKHYLTCSVWDFLTKPHRDRKWPPGETPSLFEDA